MATKYALKYKEFDDIANVYGIVYIDIFTNEIVGTVLETNSMSDISYEIKNNIVCNKDYIPCICDEVVHLLAVRSDNLEFTDVNILLNMNNVTVCNIDFSTKYTPAVDIKQFIQLLISTTDEQGENFLHLTFSRPDFDDTTFILNKAY